MPDQNVPREDLIARADAVSSAVRGLAEQIKEFHEYEEETRRQEVQTRSFVRWLTVALVGVVIALVLVGIFIGITLSNTGDIQRSQESQYRACQEANQHSAALVKYISDETNRAITLLQAQEKHAPAAQAVNYNNAIAFDRDEAAKAQQAFAPRDCSHLPH